MKKTRSHVVNEKDRTRIQPVLTMLRLDHNWTTAMLARATRYGMASAKVEHSDRLVSLAEDIKILEGCLNGEYGLSPSLADIAQRDKLDREVGLLIARRNLLNLLARRRQRTTRPTTTLESEMAMVVPEIAKLESERCVINVRMYNAKRAATILRFANAHMPAAA